MELTQIPVSNKEKNYLDEQHTHLLQCLEKATVCVDTVESGMQYYCKNQLIRPVHLVTGNFIPNWASRLSGKKSSPVRRRLLLTVSCFSVWSSGLYTGSKKRKAGSGLYGTHFGTPGPSKDPTHYMYIEGPWDTPTL